MRTLVQLFPIWFFWLCYKDKSQPSVYFIQERYEDLVKDKYECASKNENIQGTPDLFLDNDLDAALDSFDTLFCRRCLVCIYLLF